MRQQIIKTNQLSEQQFSDVYRLVETCTATDGYSIKMYWDIIQKRTGQYYSDYLFYLDEELVAYLALFRFKADAIEIITLVNPMQRRHGLAKKLFTEAFDELKRLQAQQLLIICNRQNQSLLEYLQLQPITFDHSEEQLKVSNFDIKIENLPAVHLQRAGQQDINELMTIHADCFGGEPISHQAYIQNSLDDPRYKVWLCIHNQQPVGKVHIYVSPTNEVLIHDLGIKSESRLKHMGSAMLLCLLSELKKSGYQYVTADIYSNVPGLIHYYQNCGFSIINQYDFWRIALSDCIFFLNKAK